MSLFVLQSGAPGWLASDRLVYAPEELDALLGAVQTAELLARRLEGEQEREQLAVQEAIDQARQQGRDQGRHEAAQELSTAISHLTSAYEAQAAVQRNQVASTALDIIRRIAPRIATADWIAALAAEAAQELIDAPRRVLRVHPDQIDGVNYRLQAKGVSVFDTVLADDSLASDEAEIDTGPGSVKIDLRTQLDEIARGLGDTIGTGTS